MTSRPSATLRDRINRIAYVVINVSDLERSRAFYEAVTPLRAVGMIHAPLQPFHGLGAAEGAFEGYVLEEQGAGDRPVQIHLIRWQQPSPVGAAYPCFWHVGLAKIAFRTPDAIAKLAQLRALAIRPTNDIIYRRYVSVLDPDGVTLSFPESPALNRERDPKEDPRRRERLLHVNPSVSDIKRSMHFYGAALGLDLAAESVPGKPMRASQGPGSDLSQWDSHLYAARGDPRFHIDLSQFHYPPPTLENSKPYAEANHIGISRIGFEVDELDACHQLLQAMEPVGQAPGLVAPPETWQLGGALGVRRVLCFRDPDGCRLELIEKVPVKPLVGRTDMSEIEPISIDW